MITPNAMALSNIVNEWLAHGPYTVAISGKEEAQTRNSFLRTNAQTDKLPYPAESIMLACVQCITNFPKDLHKNQCFQERHSR